MKQDFLDILEELNSAHAEYLIVGAHAMAVYGYTRATGDIDVFVNPTPANAQKVWAALHAFGAPLLAHNVKPEFFSISGNVYQIGIPPSRVDILTTISGLSFLEAVNEASPGKLAGIEFSVLSLDHLIHNKMSTGREKDAFDVTMLKQIKERLK